MNTSKSILAKQIIRNKDSIFVVLILLWITFVIAAYYVVHKPWSQENTTGLLAIADLVLALSIVGTAGGLGSRIIGQRLAGLNNLENFAVSAGIGLGIYGVFWLVVGLLGGYISWVFWAVLILSVIVLSKDIYHWFGLLGELHLDVRHPFINRFAELIFYLLISMGLLQSLAPPIKWDSLLYHLEIPRQYLRMGGIYFLPDNVLLGKAALAETLYTWGMGLHAGTTAAVIGWAAGVIGLLGTEGLSRKLLGQDASWITPIILLAGASISQALSWAYVDLWTMFFGICAIICLLLYFQESQQTWLILTGVFSGLALGSKYTAGILIPIIFIVLLVEIFVKFRRGSSRSWKRLFAKIIHDYLVFGVTAFIIFSPWMFKNWWLTQNPIYPYFFPGKGFDPLRELFYVGISKPFQLSDLVLLPWNATILGIEGAGGTGTSIGPFLLALIPGLIVGKKHLTEDQLNSLRPLAVILLTSLIFWAIAGSTADELLLSRLYFVVFPAFAILAASALHGLRPVKVGNIWIGKVIEGVVLFSLIFVLIYEVIEFSRFNPLPAITGVQTKKSYLEEQLGWYTIPINVINELPEQTKVLFLWETRGYYCEVDCSPDAIIDRWWYAMRTIGDAKKIAENFREQGFEYVLIYDWGVKFTKENDPLYDEKDWLALREFREMELEIVEDFGGVYSLYKFFND